jgi:hypothetical protein
MAANVQQKNNTHNLFIYLASFLIHNTINVCLTGYLFGLVYYDNGDIDLRVYLPANGLKAGIDL